MASPWMLLLIPSLDAYINSSFSNYWPVDMKNIQNNFIETLNRFLLVNTKAV